MCGGVTQPVFPYKSILNGETHFDLKFLISSLVNIFFVALEIASATSPS